MTFSYLNFIKNAPKSKKILLIGVFCVILVGLFFYSSIQNGYEQILTAYLELIIRSAVKLSGLIWLTVDVTKNLPDYSLTSQLGIRYLVVALGIIWVIKAKLKEKILFTGFVIVLNYILNVCQVIEYAIFQDPKYIKFEGWSIINTISTIILFFLICFYIHKNKSNVYTYFKDYITYFQYRLVFRHIFVALTLFLFAWIFILLYFDFDSWIKVIVIVANKILALFGYNSKMDSPFLRGKYGDIFVGETCLGLKIMFGFVVSIYFTGIKLFPKIRFIIIGLIIFNFLNILRIVLVFIHLQIYKNYQMAVDAHDFLKYPLHLVILILWIVWLNKYSDIWPYTKKREKSQVKL